MGELPPLHTPQGPDVPRALRPRFPRVDSSGTSRVPSSRSASFPFLASGSPHFAHLLSPGAFPPPSRSPLPSLSFPFLPLPCVRFSPVLSSSLHGPIQVPPRISPPLFPRVSLRFLPLPSLSFRPVLSGSLHSRPLRSPAVFPPTRRSDSSPFSFRIPGSAAPLSGLGFCGPRVAPKRPHTTPQERQK